MVHELNGAKVVLASAESVIDALNIATELEGGVEGRIDHLLRSLQALLNRPTRCRVALWDETGDPKVPRLISRHTLASPEDRLMTERDSDYEDILAQAPSHINHLRQQVRRNIRTPYTFVYSECVDKKWFKEVLLVRDMQPYGCIDGLCSIWAEGPDRAITVVVLRREQDPPFCELDRDLVSLMMRAMAPVIDREFLRPSHPLLVEQTLTERQREVLALLLSGDSEKEIARQLRRSVHTVHTFVRQLYDHFSVSSRGELMAMFIDQAVVRAGLGDGDGEGRGACGVEREAGPFAQRGACPTPHAPRGKLGGCLRHPSTN